MSGAQVNATATRALATKVADLEKKLTSLEITSAASQVKMDSYENRISSLEKAKEQAEHSAIVDAANFDAQTKRIDYLQSILQVSNAANQIQLPPSIFNDTEGLGANGDDDQLELLSQADASIEKDPSLRAYSEPNNWAQIQKWVDRVVEHGAEITPEATEILRKASRQVILAGCKHRFKYLKGELQRKLRSAQTIDRGNSVPVGEDQGPANTPNTNIISDSQIDPALYASITLHMDGPGPYPETSLFDLRSRAHGKCEMRTRQREGLTGDNKAKFQDAKYDSFFTPGAQSDDETEYKVVDNAWVKTGKFISRAPEYESVERQMCRDAVSAVKDPNDRARPTERIRGDPKPGAPRKAESLLWATRKWMVDPTVLAEHPEWISKGLVIENGVAWGDATEPNLPKSRKRARKADNATAGATGPGPLAEQARSARRALNEAQKRAQELRDEEARNNNHDSMAVD
ncbi:hypothetical protein RSOLAG1IB_01832 [Rhizoctonia solani AG-1 IB]|uniref:Uncharacterized protein n=1 Tax=Thanatephorus cucumeris (strain AG1-IB / isolate 7/3/14) TaxID=1108050 RepID=M5BNK4_THACB|nr:hypothetical protein BN14_02572 [Rhizoctonia solani AG-1 IB]CEL55820.1 hypothetical protein RSOLAG1IB_01832 [Rhizoctonia solani AG-1 IB]